MLKTGNITVAFDGTKILASTSMHLAVSYALLGEDLGHVFAGDAVMASAGLDRILHRAVILSIKGESYRMKEKRILGLFLGAVALTDVPTKGGPRS